MPTAVNNSYEFDEFRVEEQTRVLLRRDKPVPLTPKAFETLLVLVQNSGRLMTKDELMKALWPDSFVEEANLTQTIFMVRKALGETSNKRYIVTVPGRGYRLVADVRQVSPHRPPDLQSLMVGRQLEVRPSVRKSVWRRWLLPVAAVLLIAALGAYFQWSRSRARAHQPGERVMLAVLPFENLTGDAAQEY